MRVRHFVLVGVVGVAVAVACLIGAMALRHAGGSSSGSHVRWEKIHLGLDDQAGGGYLLPGGSATVAPQLLKGDLCNSTAPLPRQEHLLREWKLSPMWRRACEAKNKHDSVPQERNWCWIGIKQECHWNLKAHFSWEELQRKAAESGNAPPVRDEPFHPLEHPEVCDRPENGVSRRFTVEEYRMARDWFKSHVQVYVLNLPTDTERWHMISQRLQALEIEATHIFGVDMRVEGSLDSAKQEGWVPKEFNFTHAQSVAYTPRQNMGSILGTLGCAAAHFKAQDRILSDRVPLGLVMEDDSWPADDFVPRLWRLVREELPCDWNVLALYSRCPYGTCVSPHLARVRPDANEPFWRCRQGVNWGMHAILYRTETLPEVQKIWRKTVFDEERPHCMDVDVALASISDKVGYYAVPNVQEPPFVKETNHRSARWDINQAAVTTTTSTSTSFIYVPRIKPGEPWPGAWNFG